MQNTSGMRPAEFNVLVRQEATPDRTKGGLLLPADVQDREKFGTTRGMIVAVAPLAFNEDVWPVTQPKPGPGTRIVFARHAGSFVTGEDGEEYRVIKDKDVVAVMEATDAGA